MALLTKKSLQQLTCCSPFAHICMYVCMYACMHACMHACMYIIYIYIYICMYVYMYIHMCTCIRRYIIRIHLCIHMYIRIYIYICICIHREIESERERAGEPLKPSFRPFKCRLRRARRSWGLDRQRQSDLLVGVVGHLLYEGQAEETMAPEYGDPNLDPPMYLYYGPYAVY